MEAINSFTSTTEDIREAINGFYGTEIGKDYKISYIGWVILAEGNLDTIKKKISKDVYEWKGVGNNVYVAWIIK